MPLISFLLQAIKESMSFFSCKKQLNLQTDIKEAFHHELIGVARYCLQWS